MTKLSLVLFLWFCGQIIADETCSLTEAQKNEEDPALMPMSYDVGNGEETFMAYVEPDMNTFYRGNPPATRKVTPKFKGLSTKFINMSPDTVYLYWEAHRGKLHPMNRLAPFEASGTASFPGHNFVITEDGNEDNILVRFDITAFPNNVYTYDPYLVENDEEATERNLSSLTAEDRAKYDKWKATLLFNDQYKEFTGRSYLANYVRDPPRHHMWRADYFGQEHWAISKETHFMSIPESEKFAPVTFRKSRSLREEDPQFFADYRDPNQSQLNMTLKALSCAPRVFEIPNFLSPAEIDHILKIAGGVELKRSSVGDVGQGKSKASGEKTSTRTSFNSWVPRHRDPILDSVYRRSADLLRIDEALLRARERDEFPDWPTKGSLAEELQLVHYDPGQEYTDHHDFGFSDLNEPQGARFATLLLYLNDNMQGGETSFPRWSNAEHFERLKVKPEEGKAVLFYSQLPDGNLDDLSQHAALPVKVGEKWLINLWVWDPVYR